MKWQTLVNEATLRRDCGDLMLEVRGWLILSTPLQLPNHYNEIKGNAHVKNTIISISQRHAALRVRMQEADGGEMIAGVVGRAVSPAVSRSRYAAGIVGVRGGSEGGNAAAGAGVSALAAAGILDFVGGGDEAA